MKLSLRNRLSLATSAMVLVTSAPALAQSGAAEAADSSDIIVTARRTEERLQDVPISISVFNQEQLADRNIVNSADLAAYTPSLAVNSRYGSDKASFALRGFSQELNTMPTVGVYFADVIAPRLQSNIQSGNGAGVGSMFDLQNVQVLKGPQGTLFGRNTTGGAILLVPQRPTGDLEGYVEGTYGNHDAMRGQAVINLPLADTFKVRIGVDRYKRDGWLNNRTAVGPRHFNDINYFAARIGVLAELTPDIENYTLFTYARSNTNGTVGKIAVCNRDTIPGLSAAVRGAVGATSVTRLAACAQLDRDRTLGYGYYDVENNTANPYVVGRQWQAINTMTLTLSDDVTAKSIMSYGESKERYSFSLNGDNFPFPFVITHPGPFGKGQGDQYTLTNELQFQGNMADGALTWQAGGYLERSGPSRGINGQEQYTQIFSTCTNIYAFQCTPLTVPNPLAPGGVAVVGNLGVARNVYYYRSYGLYAQATYKLSEQFSITAGVRNTWDWVKEYADNVRVTTNAAGPIAFTCSRGNAGQLTPAPAASPDLFINRRCTRVFTQKSSRPTWLIDLEYKPIDDVMIYAKYARGYRGGGINEANVGAETWNPEKIDNFELGVKASFTGPISGTASLGGFWNEFKDQQASVTIPQCTAAQRPLTCTNPAPTGINGIQNIGKSRIRGIEADGSLTFWDAFRLDFGYAYLDAVVKGGSVPFCDNSRFECGAASFLTAGARLPFAPKHRITVTGTYTLPLDESLGRLSVGATFTHTSDQFFSHSNDLAFAIGAIPFNPSIIPATNLLNLNLNWKGIAGSPVDVALFATNVTKKKYYVASTNGLSTSGGEFIIQGEPRMVGVRLRYNFGE